MILTFLMYALTNNMNYRGVNRFEHDFDDFQKTTHSNEWCGEM